MQDNLEVALELARAGAYVFPCQSEGAHKKQPGKGVYWRSVSTRDEREIRALWYRYPDAVPGIDLAKSGWFVVDCDRKLNNGLEWFTAYAARFDEALDACPVVDTPSGGRHHYFRNTLNPPQTNARGALPSKKEADIDLRGHGGFVIGPGATFTDGSGTYTAHGFIGDAQDPPDWLIELLRPAAPSATASAPISVTVQPERVSDERLAAYGEAALEELLRELAAAQHGERNETANRIGFRVGQLVSGGCLTRISALAALEQAALAAWGVNPRDRTFGPRGTFARALKAGEGSPSGPDDTPGQPVDIQLAGSAPPTNVIPFPTPHAPIASADTELPEHLTNVPGLVGDITDWIADTARYPQRALALGAALTIVGTAAGRHVAGPTRSGTHLYVIGLAKSGAGKDHALSCISTIMTAAGLREHVGPREFISMPAAINFLVRKPLSVCAMDEFGAFLKRINNKRASGFEGAISGILRTAWGASFAAMSTPEWAQRASETIYSPAMSIYGVSTPEEFYKALEGGDITNGVLNRFLIIETKIRPKEREPLADPGEVPADIGSGLKRIYNRNPIACAQLCQSQQPPAYDRVTITAEAERVRRELVAELTARGDADASVAPFLARTAENAIRLATIVAIGANAIRPEIDVETMHWAREFAVWCTDRLAEGAGLYIADTEEQERANAVVRAIHKAGGRIKRRDLIRALDHKYSTRNLDDCLRALKESERVAQNSEAPPGGGTATIFYSVLNS